MVMTLERLVDIKIAKNAVAEAVKIVRQLRHHTRMHQCPRCVVGVVVVVPWMGRRRGGGGAARPTRRGQGGSQNQNAAKRHQTKSIGPVRPHSELGVVTQNVFCLQ